MASRSFGRPEAFLVSIKASRLRQRKAVPMASMVDDLPARLAYPPPAGDFSQEIYRAEIAGQGEIQAILQRGQAPFRVKRTAFATSRAISEP